MRSEWTRAALVLAAAGATVGTALDALHVYGGTTAYAHPALGAQAWWVPPLFAAAAVAFGLARPFAERIAATPSDAPSGRAVAAGMVLFVCAYLVSAVGDVPWPVRSALLLLVFARTWRVVDDTALGGALAVLGAIVGTAVEVALVAGGAFFYREHDLEGVAPWLPVLYLTAACATGALGKHLVDG